MFTAYTDGACSGNANADKSKTKAGYGVYFETPIVVNGKKITKISGPVDRSKISASNNRGEIMGILRCLDVFRGHLDGKDDKKEKKSENATPLPALTVYSDSQYCINTCNKWLAGWKANPKKHADKLNMDLWDIVWGHITHFREIYGGDYENKIQFKWVRGHNGTHGNEVADQLATQGVHLEKEKRIVLKKNAAAS